MSEDSFGSSYLRLLVPIIVFLVAVIGAYSVAFYAMPVAAVVAVASAGLAFKFRSIGLLLAMLAMAPAYGYQIAAIYGGVWGVIFLGIMILLAFVSAGLARTHFRYFLGVAVGAVAGYLMPTPLYFAGIVIILTFTVWYRFAPKLTAVIVFLLSYLPLMFVNSPPLQSVSDVLPVYSQVTRLAGSLSEIDLQVIVGYLVGFGATVQRRISFYDSLETFFVKGYSGWLFIALSIISVIVAHGLSRTINKRMGGIHLTRNLFLDTFAVFGGWLVFIAPLSVMQSAMRYRVDAADPYVGIAQASLIVVASVVSFQAASVYRKMADLGILRAEVASLVADLKEKVQEFSKQLVGLKTDLGLSIGDEMIRIKTLEESIIVIGNTYGSLNRKGLEERRRTLREASLTLNSLESEARHHLSDFYVQLAKEYDYSTKRLGDLGVYSMAKISLIDASSKSREEVIAAITGLKEGLKQATEKMVQRSQELLVMARKFEPEFSSSVFAIAQEFYSQGEYARALHSVIEAIDLTFKKFGPVTSNTLLSCQALTKEIIDHVDRELIPLLEELGDEVLVPHIKSIPLISFDSAELRPKNSAFDLFRLAKVKDELPPMLIQLTRGVDQKLLEMEKWIDSSIPPNFSWSKDYDIHLDVEKFLADFAKLAKESGTGFAEPSVSGLELLKRLTKRLDAYVTMTEFVKNYRNVERMISTKLLKMSKLEAADLPVKMAKEYLRLYALKHPDTSFDSRRTTLILQIERRSGE